MRGCKTPSIRGVMGRAVIAVVVGCCWGSPVQARTHRLSLSQTIDLALRQNRQIKGARARVSEAEAARKAVRGHIGPKLSLEGTLMFWDSEQAFDLGIDASAIPPPFDTMFGGDMVVREQLTTQLSIVLAQPLTPLYQAFKGHKMAALGRDAAKDGVEAASQAIAAATTQAYIGVIQARTGTAIARTAVAQVKAAVKQAKAFFRAGLASRTDVLKAELAQAQAEEGLLKAESAISLAQSGLTVVAGLPRGDRIEPVQRFADPPPAYGASLEQCTRGALARRPDLMAGAKQVAITERGRDVARWELVPQVVAMANYTHSTGSDLAYPTHSFFVGGVLKWDLWQWGAKYYKIEQASHQLTRERQDLEARRDNVVLEVKTAYLALRLAEKTLKVANKGVALAEEAYRIEQAKFARAAATTTDVLDAQLALTRAKLGHSNALYGWYVARAKLSQAIGA